MVEVVGQAGGGHGDAKRERILLEVGRHAGAERERAVEVGGHALEEREGAVGIGGQAGAERTAAESAGLLKANRELAETARRAGVSRKGREAGGHDRREVSRAENDEAPPTLLGRDPGAEDGDAGGGVHRKLAGGAGRLAGRSEPHREDGGEGWVHSEGMSLQSPRPSLSSRAELQPDNRHHHFSYLQSVKQVISSGLCQLKLDGY